MWNILEKGHTSNILFRETLVFHAISTGRKSQTCQQFGIYTVADQYEASLPYTVLGGNIKFGKVRIYTEFKRLECGDCHDIYWSLFH